MFLDRVAANAVAAKANFLTDMIWKCLQLLNNPVLHVPILKSVLADTSMFRLA